MITNNEVLRSSVNATAGTDNQLVAAVTGKRIRVLAYDISNVGTAATNITFKSGADAIYPTIQSGANGGGRICPDMDYGWCETAVGSALNATLGSGSAQGIQIIYALI